MTVPSGTGALEATQQLVLTQLQAGSGNAQDLSTTGTISAAQSGINTPVSNATVVLAVGNGQSTWKAQVANGGGGFTSGTTLVADKSVDGGTTWYSASFKVTGASPATSVSSVVGPGPLELTGNCSGVTHVRIRSSILNSTETIAVTLRASVGIGDIGLASSIPAGSNVIGGISLSQVNGSTLSQSNPVITETNIQNWLRNGQAFVANGRGLTATNNNLLNCALSIFNPSNSGKNILIYSLKCMVSTTGGTLSQWNLTTSDPGTTTGFTTAVTPNRLPGATSPSNIASVYQTASGNTTTVAAPGTKVEEFLLTAATSTEILTNSASILLSPGNGIAVMLLVGTAAGYYQSFAKWIEF